MTQDNRIRFDAPLIDFVNTVGVTGQAHDDYPMPDSQARFDHLRIFLIGLLSSQSSANPPTQYRDGTWWFDLNTNTIKIRSNDQWVNLSSAIKLDLNVDNSVLSLQDWYDSASSIIKSFQTDILFRYNITSSNISSLPIPSNLQNKITPGSIALVYVNGILLDPFVTTIEPELSPSLINLPYQLTVGDLVTVIIKYIPSDKLEIQVQEI